MTKRLWWLLAAANGAYAMSWFALGASRRPLWYDELFTVRLGQLTSVRELWQALTAGIDFNPPGFYVATRIAHRLPVDGLVAPRLPALVGAALVMATLFVFIHRRMGTAVATAIVALMPLSSYVERYAIEARAYMLVLGMAGCALVSWQSLGDSTGRARIPAAIALSVSVACALMLHVWAVLLPAALLAGEAFVTIRTRRVRWLPMAALAAAAPVLALYPALLAASRTVTFDNVVYTPTLSKLGSAFSTAAPRIRAVLLLSLVVIAAHLFGRIARAPAAGHVENTGGRGLHGEERTMFVGLLVSPLVPYAYAVASRGAFMPRYGLFAVVGTIGLLADLLWRTSRSSTLARAAAVVTASVLLWAYLPARAAVPPDAEVPSLRVLRSLDRHAIASTPVVLVNPLDVLAIDERATDRERQSLTFVADPALEARFTGTNLPDDTYLRGEGYLRVRIPRMTYHTLTTMTRRLVLVGEWQPLAWLPQKLAEDGWTLTRVGGTDDAPLFAAAR
jgi:hypothetical protein